MENTTSVNRVAEEKFLEIFSEAFGPDKANNLYTQYPIVDIYGGHRYIDFALENQDSKIAIEIDSKSNNNGNYDDLLKYNSMVYQDWKVYRWAYNQLVSQPEKVKDELVTFLGETPFFKTFQEYLPNQQGEIIELRDYQKEALYNLDKMRKNGDTIAILYHATGVGKTITAASDAKEVGGRTLFLVNALKLADQAERTFEKVWPEASRGQYTGSEKVTDTKVVFATVQSISKNLLEFHPKSFDYIIVDECHHAAAKTYKKIFSYFNAKFILGLTATPERADGEDMLTLFQNVAHKMDLETAVKKGILAPIKCIRIKTDIDLTDVRIHGIKYNSQDLESKLFIPARNKLIVDTYVNFVNGKKTVIFCASIDHATEISKLLVERGVNAESISGRDKPKVRDKILNDYENGSINVLCACDLLNEGWDSPKTEVLFMARPTMSKTIYMQQLGRGTRKCKGKENLLVFDFVDNTNMFNRPYSLHRLLNLKEYHPNEYVLAPENKKKTNEDKQTKEEKPTEIIDIPINVYDYETVDLFNWQDEVKTMLSQKEFIRRVDVQSETIDRYVKNGDIKPDLSIPISDNKTFNYYKEDTVIMYAKKYGWDLITPTNIKEKFMKFVDKMDMLYSYKPVLLKAIFAHINEYGRVSVCDIVNYFVNFYEERKDKGLIAEKPTSIYQKGGYTGKDVERNIFNNPFKRFADMRFLQHSKNIEYIQVNPYVFRKLSGSDISHILQVCDEKLDMYYEKITK